MGRIAHIQVQCAHCGKTTDAYIEETGGERADVKCQHCKKVFEFGPGTLYKPIGYVAARPSWAEAKDDAPSKQAKPAKSWWQFWK